MKKLFLFPFLLLSGSVLAQYSTHYMSWQRLEWQEKINSNTNFQFIYQHRRQDIEENAQIFTHFFQQSIWTLLHYRPTKNITISLSPFAFFHVSPFAITASDLERSSRKEFRWTVRAGFSQNLNNWTYLSRYGLEYRLVQSADLKSYQANWRFRFQSRFQRPIHFLHEKTQLIIFDELFVQFGNGFNERFGIFDQNRLFLGLNIPISDKLNVEFGYMNVYQERGILPNFAMQHNLWINCIFQNLFKKRNEISSKN